MQVSREGTAPHNLGPRFLHLQTQSSLVLGACSIARLWVHVPSEAQLGSSPNLTCLASAALDRHTLSAQQPFEQRVL